MGAIDKAIAHSVPVIPRPVVRKISNQYIAGDTLEDAVATVQYLNRWGCVATIDLLGENTKGKADTFQKLKDYEQILNVLDENDLHSGVSVKLTSLGLNLNEELCRANLEEVITYAGELGRFVRVDMEGSQHAESTLRIVHDMHCRHGNTGAVVQAYMRRSLEDVEELVHAGITARICKGIYDEPREVAYKDFDTVRESYVALMEKYLRGGVYVGIATHDEHLVYHALRLIHELKVPADRYEFQMLLGVDEQLQRILVEEGHRVRVYVPFGENWYEYSTRRLKENPKIAGYVARDVLGRLTGHEKK